MKPQLKWEKVPYSNPGAAEFCDTSTGRYYVARTGPAARRFRATLNGMKVLGATDTLAEGKQLCEKHWQAVS